MSPGAVWRVEGSGCWICGMGAGLEGVGFGTEFGWNVGAGRRMPTMDIFQLSMALCLGDPIEVRRRRGL